MGLERKLKRQADKQKKPTFTSELQKSFKRKQEERKYGAYAPSIQEKMKTSDAFDMVSAQIKKYDQAYRR